MGQTANGLPNGGQTDHYRITYDDSLPTSDGLDRALALLGACESDFELMAGWFSGVSFQWSFPIVVQLNNAGGGASWDGPPGIDRVFGGNTTVQLNPGPGTDGNLLRYLLVEEVTEMFMASQNAGWFYNEDFFNEGNEGSKGEGLSRFLGGQFLITNNLPENSFGDYIIVPTWLNGDRTPFIENTPDDHTFDAVNGCTTAFIYYLHDQLGFSVEAIIGAAADNLADVYANLTGRNDATTAFLSLVNQYYPPVTRPYSTIGDRLFPVARLDSLGDVQVLSGGSASTFLSLDNPALADVAVEFSTDNLAWLPAPTTATFTPGDRNMSVTVTAAALTGPARTVNIHAFYAGRTVTGAVTILPRPSIIRGQVTDENGAPIPGASILILADGEILPGAGDSLQLTTDPNGYYQSPVVPPQTYRVSADQSGYVPSDVVTIVLYLGVPQVDQNFVLQITRPFVILGSVTTTDAAGIGGATVTLTQNAPIPQSVSVTAGPLGDFELGMDPGPYNGDYTFYVSATGFVSQTRDLTIPNGAFLTGEDFQLVALGSLDGVVLDPTGAPIPGARVSNGASSVYCAADGTFNLTAIDPGPVTITVTAPTFDTLTISVTVTSGLATTRDLVLTPATAVVSGLVTNALFSSPVVGALVSAASSQATTDASGAFSLTEVPAGAIAIEVSAKGFESLEFTLQVEDRQSYVLPLLLSPLLHSPGAPPGRFPQ